MKHFCLQERFCLVLLLGCTGWKREGSEVGRGSRGFGTSGIRNTSSVAMPVHRESGWDAKKRFGLGLSIDIETLIFTVQ